MKALEQNKLASNIWKFYLLEILSGMFFSVPVIVLFWQANGLSVQQILLLQAIFSFVALVFEIPTGYFADIYGRKKSLLLFGILFAAGILMYSFGHYFYQFVLLEIIFGLSLAFLSGAAEAFVYDTLVDLHQQQYFKKIWGKGMAYGMVAMAVSNIIGGFIAQYDLRYPFYASVPFFTLLIPVALSLHEPHAKKPIIQKDYLRILWLIIKTVFTQQKKLRWLIIYAGIIFSFNQTALWLYQPYFKLIKLDIVYFGIVFASFQLVAAAASKYSHKLEHILGGRYSLILLVVLLVISYLLMSNFVFLFSFSFVWLQQFVRGFVDPVMADYINKLTETHIRATVLSVKGMIEKILYSILLIFAGWFTNIFSLTQTLGLLGILVLLVGSAVLFILHRTKVV